MHLHSPAGTESIAISVFLASKGSKPTHVRRNCHITFPNCLQRNVHLCTEDLPAFFVGLPQPDIGSPPSVDMTVWGKDDREGTLTIARTQEIKGQLEAGLRLDGPLFPHMIVELFLSDLMGEQIAKTAATPPAGHGILRDKQTGGKIRRRERASSCRESCSLSPGPDGEIQYKR